MILRMEARISSIVGSCCGFAELLMARALVTVMDRKDSRLPPSNLSQKQTESYIGKPGICDVARQVEARLKEFANVVRRLEDEIENLLEAGKHGQLRVEGAALADRAVMLDVEKSGAGG